MITVKQIEDAFEQRVKDPRPFGVLEDAALAGLDADDFRRAVENGESEWIESPRDVALITLGALAAQDRLEEQGDASTYTYPSDDAGLAL